MVKVISGAEIIKTINEKSDYKTYEVIENREGMSKLRNNESDLESLRSQNLNLFSNKNLNQRDMVSPIIPLDSANRSTLT